MACIKCGKESTAGAEFCEECLKDMERYPVKPGTPVILPKHAEYLSAKHPRKKALKPEQQVVRLKKAVRCLLWVCLALLLLLVAAVIGIVYLLDGTPTSLLP